MKSIFLIAVVLIFSVKITNVYPQDERGYPEIGIRSPEFILEGIINYPKNKISLSELKGKYVILDFWQRGCLACITGFQKLNEIHKEYSGKLTIISIGEEDKEGKIRSLFNRLKAKNKYVFPAAFDSTLVNRFVYRFFPCYVWIDKEGVIVAITGAQDLTTENIDSFIVGKSFSFIDASYEGYLRNRQQTSMLQNNGFNDTNYLVKSELRKWKSGMALLANYTIDAVNVDQYKNTTFQTFGSLLIDLYRIAYWGISIPRNLNIFQDPILEVSDSTKFVAKRSGNSQGMYTYSLSCATEYANRENMMYLMQCDLEKLFPYSAHIEIRMMPCYALRIIDKRKISLLKPIGRHEKQRWGYTGGIRGNIPIEEAANSLVAQLSNSYRILNETSISGNVNLRFHADLWDINDIRLKLRKQGLDIVLIKRPMKVLVIRDK